MLSWSTHVNSYFPIQSRQQNGSTEHVEDFGIYGYRVAQGYEYYDAFFIPYAVVGNGIGTAAGTNDQQSLD